MLSTGTVGLLIAIVTILYSLNAFRRVAAFDRYLFSVERVLRYKQYYRLLSVGLVHADWKHLGFNMYALLSFAGAVEAITSPWQMLILYVVSLLGGSLCLLYFHRNDNAYEAVGASGAVSGVIFASIVVFPSISVSPLFMPFSMPGWLFGLLYTLYTIYGIKSLHDNVAHEGHLGGALSGIIAICLLNLNVLRYHWPFVVILTLPTLVFLYFIVTRPEWLYLKGFSLRHDPNDTIDQRYNGQRAQQQREIDRILDKISAKGIDSLTQTERDILKNQ
jgi:membrane associated rhomboid family serine protease